jgi:hypothetical protein
MKRSPWAERGYNGVRIKGRAPMGSSDNVNNKVIDASGNLQGAVAYREVR